MGTPPEDEVQLSGDVAVVPENDPINYDGEMAISIPDDELQLDGDVVMVIDEDDGDKENGVSKINASAESDDADTPCNPDEECLNNT